jgi:twitching motility protein PilT
MTYRAPAAYNPGVNDLIRDPDLDRLVGELNRDSPGEGAEAEPLPPLAGLSPGSPGSPAQLTPLTPVDDDEPIARLLTEMTRRGASDLLLIPDVAPVLRLNGRLQPTDRPPLEEEDLHQMFRSHLPPRARDSLALNGSGDFSLHLSASGEGGEGIGGFRFRVNLHRQRGRLAAAVRALPREIPTLAQLHLPKSLQRLVQPTRGLVLVCGPTGSGKTSTLAALLGEINRSRAAHIITIEDPVEYEHHNARSLVEQIEIGSDAPSFAAALRAALRQDPDVILVGEMRDLETVATALTAAETGHLILSTLHTSDVVQAVHRIVDVFPSDQQTQIRQQLALSLNAIVFQQLLPRSDGQGRVPAVEILMGTYPVRHHIRNQSLQKLYNEITLGRSQGMVTLEESLAGLVRAGMVSHEEAQVRSAHPDELESLLRG